MARFIVLKNTVPQMWVDCAGLVHLKRVLADAKQGEIWDVLSASDDSIDPTKWHSVMTDDDEVTVGTTVVTFGAKAS
jgi:hypothetical protein